LNVAAGAAGIPSFKVVAAALRTTTERLARELAQPGETAPHWDDFEWDVARAVCGMHGISVLLARRLHWRGPSSFQRFLAEQVEHGLRREVRADALRLRLDELLRRERVPVVALKGAALRPLALHSPGDRPMGDIDLLARREDLAAITRALAQVGYQPLFAVNRHHVFQDSATASPRGFGEHVDNPLKIEVHTHIAEALPVEAVNITERLWPAAPRPGINEYPDLGALMAHLLLHAAGNMRAHALRCVQLVDIARLAPRLGGEDWASLRGWWALPPLLLAQRYCDARIPAAVLDTLRRACPARLARAAGRHLLTDV
jgi:putative nucleotidyltransferase-like protein